MPRGRGSIATAAISRRAPATDDCRARSLLGRYQGVIDTPRCVGEGCLDIIKFQIGKLIHNFGMGEAGRQQVKDIDNSDAQPTYAGPPAEFVGIGSDTSK